MNVKDINTAIVTGSWTNDELSSIIDAIKFARSQLTQRAKFSLKVGSQVQFTSAKTGMTYTGSVEKIAQKFATVNTGTGRWKVPMNMLETA